MNKLTPIIKKYLTEKYRGHECFQNETWINDIYNIYNFLTYINERDGRVEVSSGSKSCEYFYNEMGLTEYGLRKNVFPTLERIGLIKRIGKGNSWNFVEITESGKSITLLIDDEDIEESVRRSFRTLLSDKDFSQVIKRIKDLNVDWGKITWWETWFCLRLDIDFDVVRSDVKSIRSLYKIKTITKNILDQITNDFDEHEVKQGDFNSFLNVLAIKNKGTLDFNNLRNKISNGLGTKLVHYGLRVDNSALYFTVDLQQSRNSRKVSRKYKRTDDILISGKISDFDYHHIVPFDNSHFNPELHKDIDDIKNLIPITYEDHKKIPTKGNHYLILNVSNDGKIRFHSYRDLSDYIELKTINHINIEKLKEMYIPYNRELYKKVI
jgi:hypothetical protein